MSFLDCPPEITDRIISYLDSIRDAAALSLSSRRLRSLCDITTRRRFHRICVYPNDQSIDEAFGLLMDILKRPCLGRYVREIEHYWRPDCEVEDEEEERKKYLRDLGEDEIHNLKNAVQSAGFMGPKEHLLINMLMQNTSVGGGPDSYRFIGNSPVSPNLVSLALTQPFYYYRFYADPEIWPLDPDDYPLDRVLSYANAHSENSPYFQNLRKVYVTVEEAGMVDDKRYCIYNEFLRYLTLFDKLSSIESVSIDALSGDENDNTTLELGTSNISRLYINHLSLETTYIARAILSCKALREFQFSVRGRATHDGGYRYFNVKTFIKAICRHKTTLESLDVEVERHLQYINESEDDEIERQDVLGEPGPDSHEEIERNQFFASCWGNSGSLKDFVTLKRLSLGFGFLLYFAKGVSGISGEKREQRMLAESLPDSLEYLCIRGYQGHKSEKYDAQVDALMALCGSVSSNLKVVTGVEEMIPNAEDEPNYDDHILWSLEDADYGP